MSKLVALKLLSGEELVVEIIAETETEITFKNPVSCGLRNTPNGPALGFLPWMQASNGPFNIKLDKIVCVAEVAEEVKTGYNQIYGAGIVVPTQQLITG
jgi:hypothetical protein